MELNKNNAEAIDLNPSPGIMALLYFILFVGGMIINLTGTSGAAYPTPYNSVEIAQAYYQNFQEVTRLYSLFVFLTALPIGIYTANITSRLSDFGIHHGGLNIAKFGGWGASIFIALSGLSTWILSQPLITDAPETTRLMQLLSFTTGGTGFIVFLGLLIGSISVTAGSCRLLPRWLKWSGLVIAILSVLSMFNMMFVPASALLLIGRILGVIWMIIAGFKLKRT